MLLGLATAAGRLRELRQGETGGQRSHGCNQLTIQALVHPLPDVIRQGLGMEGPLPSTARTVGALCIPTVGLRWGLFPGEYLPRPH